MSDLYVVRVEDTWTLVPYEDEKFDFSSVLNVWAKQSISPLFFGRELVIKKITLGDLEYKDGSLYVEDRVLIEDNMSEVLGEVGVVERLKRYFLARQAEKEMTVDSYLSEETMQKYLSLDQKERELLREEFCRIVGLV